MTIRTRSATLAAALLMTGAALGALPSPAHAAGAGASPAARAADPGQAPVTAPDTARVAADGYAEVEVLANDSDPDDASGADLAICRVTVPDGVALQASPGESYDFDEGGGYTTHPSLDIFPTGARPGRYTLTYYACDYHYLTPATVTVTVTHAEQISANALRSRPGIVRFHNPGSHRVRITYGGPRQQTPDGAFAMRPHTDHDVRVHRHSIVWSGSYHTADTSATIGSEIRGIRLPRHDRGAPGRPVAGTDRATWLGARSAQSARSARSAQGSTTRAAGGSAQRRAATGSAPVTGGDRTRVHQDAFRFLDVLGNDSDPDDATGADLAVCRLQATTRRGLVVQIATDGGFFVAGRRTAEPATSAVVVGAGRRLPTGTYTLTYYACDYDYLTPATITVTVTRSIDVTAHKARRPGYVRFHNPAGHPVTVVITPTQPPTTVSPAGPSSGGSSSGGSTGGSSARGHRARHQVVTVGAHRTEVVRVTSRAIDYYAHHGPQSAGYGEVRGIRQP